MDPQSNAWIVIDAGSHSTKVGMGGNDEPSVVFPSWIEKSLQYRSFNRSPRSLYVGQHVLYEIDRIKAIKPICKTITNYEDWQILMEFSFSQVLNKRPEEHGLFLAEPYFCPKPQREKCLEVAMETWNVPFYSTASAPVLSMYSEGLTTGLVCDLGEQGNKIIPLVEGYGLPHAVTEFGDFGQEATEALIILLSSKGIFFPHPSQRIEMEKAKAQCAFIRPFDPTAPLPAHLASQFTTMDRKVIDLGDQWDYPTDLLFNPRNKKSIQSLFYSSASKCFAEQRELYSNILITGGGAQLPGLAERLQIEIQNLTTFSVRVRCHPLPIHSAWLGMSTLTNISSFDHMVIHKDEYDEFGPSVVHRKCFV